MGELCQTARCHMGGGSTGFVEVHHALCLCQRGEPLRPPLTGIVGGLVTDFDSHGVGCVVSVFYRVSRGSMWRQGTVHQLSYGGSVGGVARGSSKQPQSEPSSLSSEIEVHHTIFTVTALGVSEVIGLGLATRLCIHGTAVEVKSALIFLPFFHRTVFLKQGILLLQEVSVEIAFGIGHYIISEEDGRLIVLLTAEHIDNTFLRKSTIVGRICLLRRLTLNVVSFAVMMYTEVRRVLNTIGLIFISQVVLFQKFFNLVLMMRIVLRVAGVLKIQNFSKELIQSRHLILLGLDCPL